MAHTNLRDANVLWDKETERAMMIDFEQAVLAVLAERPRLALASLVPKKKMRLYIEVDTNTAIGKPESKSDANRLKT